MNSRAFLDGSRRLCAPGAIAASFLGASILGGCAAQWGGERPDVVQVNLAPGVTRACYTDPCGVMFTLPGGAEPYTVRANDLVVGTYPAGQQADLGAFYREDSPVRLTVDGVERSTAVLYLLEPYSY